MIDNAYQRLLDGYLRSNHRKKVDIIDKAYRFARLAHEGIRRRSGEPYIMHPIAVATIVSQEIGLGSTSICAALLHDVVEDTDYTIEDIEAQFGKKIAQIVDGLTKISGGIFGDLASVQAENFRKLLLTMSDDIRVVLIKMADRLHNMRTLQSMPPQKQYKIAGETLYIYAPLAHRLGLFAIKTELEDLSFKHEHPDAYARIEQQLALSEAKRNELFARFSAPIRERLDRMGLNYEFRARIKSCYSIWKKMETKHIPFEEVYDLYAARIVFECDHEADEKRICWNIYSEITDLYRLHPDRVRDWISTPKANGYMTSPSADLRPTGSTRLARARKRASWPHGCRPSRTSSRTPSPMRSTSWTPSSSTCLPARLWCSRPRVRPSPCPRTPRCWTWPSCCTPSWAHTALPARSTTSWCPCRTVWPVATRWRC